MNEINMANRPLSESYNTGCSGPVADVRIPESPLLSVIKTINSDPAAARAFKEKPQSLEAKAMYRELTLANLPENLRSMKLSDEGEQAKMLLGIIAGDIASYDMSAFNNVFSLLSEMKPEGDAKNNPSMENEISKELGRLMHKYGQNSLNKQKEAFKEECRKAWQHHHNRPDGGDSDDKIFNKSFEACENMFKVLSSQLTKPNQSWATLTQNGAFFEYATGAIAKTLIHHDPDQPDAGHQAATPPPATGADNADVAPQRFTTSVPADARDIHITINGGNGGNAVIYGSPGHVLAEGDGYRSKFNESLCKAPLDDAAKIKLLDDFSALQRKVGKPDNFSHIASATAFGDDDNVDMQPAAEPVQAALVQPLADKEFTLNSNTDAKAESTPPSPDTDTHSSDVSASSEQPVRKVERRQPAATKGASGTVKPAPSQGRHSSLNTASAEHKVNASWNSLSPFSFRGTNTVNHITRAYNDQKEAEVEINDLKDTYNKIRNSMKDTYKV
ncbi:hypothetical protein GKQ23_06060 [Erwinia sp. E602]|uniref:hypothetical protein n=1 Tax=Erwinia sp. E602 TaxID=2675378 RepID=UPI001BA6609A|nr:hypothetical protein [Erwinia sp. E602]QUG74597.1 hypothetical protein GKQ23_06060 [Erwinia sp. E602]